MNLDRLLWELDADDAVFTQKGEEIKLNHPVVVFYKNNEFDSRLEALQGFFNKRTRDFTVIGNVEVMNRDSVFLESDSLVWKEEEKILETESLVHVSNDSYEMWGEGMETDVSLNRIHLKKNVRGKGEHLTISKGKPAEVDGADNR
jgi:LPS export ABC transporter protein LptC